LTAIDGHCVFLQDDGLCAIHATHGEAAKPGFCREFPFHIVQERTNTVGIIRAECEGWYKSFTQGPIIDDRLESVQKLPRVVPHRSFTNPQVMLFPRSAISLEHWDHMEGELLRCLQEEGRGVEGDIGELRNVILTLAKQPSSPSQKSAYLGCAGKILAPMTRTLSAVLQIPHADPHQVVFTQNSLSRIQQTLRAIESDSLPPYSQSEAEYYNIVLQNWIMGKLFQGVGSLSAGLGAFALGALVARCNAEENDLESNATHYAAWLRFSGIPMIQQSLLSSQPVLHQLFMNVSTQD
jgi:hypothetical protein